MHLQIPSQVLKELKLLNLQWGWLSSHGLGFLQKWKSFAWLGKNYFPEAKIEARSPLLPLAKLASCLNQISNWKNEKWAAFTHDEQQIGFYHWTQNQKTRFVLEHLRQQNKRFHANPLPKKPESLQLQHRKIRVHTSLWNQWLSDDWAVHWPPRN